MPTYYKVLNDNGKPKLGTGHWHLPKANRPAKWMPKLSSIALCVKGYHVVDADHLVEFLDYGHHIYEVEIRGAVLSDGSKLCAQQARLVKELKWGEREARLFACDCAERALDRWAEHGTVDQRSREAIAVSRRYAEGEASSEELTAAGAAAGAAAGDAAWAAAGAAAGAAAWAAAGDAARAAAWDAERKWQDQRLLDYLYGRV